MGGGYVMDCTECQSEVFLFLNSIENGESIKIYVHVLGLFFWRFSSE